MGLGTTQFARHVVFILIYTNILRVKRLGVCNDFTHQFLPVTYKSILKQLWKCVVFPEHWKEHKRKTVLSPTYGFPVRNLLWRTLGKLIHNQESLQLERLKVH